MLGFKNKNKSNNIKENKNILIDKNQINRINSVKYAFSDDFKFIQIEDVNVLLKECEKYISDKKQIREIEKAYYFAERKHYHQKRKSGEPFIVHPLSCAYYLAQWKMSHTTIIAGLLHDVVEDTWTTSEEISDSFGDSVAYIVEAVTKVSHFTKENREKIKAEYLKKIFISMTKDIRVIIVKIADRLHNVLTLKYQPLEKQKKIAYETLKIFAPLAGRIGIKVAKDYLEDEAFKILEPDEYNKIAKSLETYNLDYKHQIKKIILDISKLIENDKSLKGTIIFGRTKTINSIYRKIIKGNKSFEELNDILAIRLITEKKYDCYKLLAMIHEMYVPIANRFKDYIAVPKTNKYQSLHSSVIDKNGIIFEVQIRTFEMNDLAEFGVAAHWRYKETNSSNDEKEDLENLSDIGIKNIDMFSKLVMLEKTSSFETISSWDPIYENGSKNKKIKKNIDEIEQVIRYDFLAKSIVVLTTDQKSWTIPHGSSVIDLAYKINPEIGNSLCKTKINGLFMPITTPLNDGDIIELITNSNSKPSARWLKFVRTTIAKKEIEKYIENTLKVDEEKINAKNLKNIRNIKEQIDTYILNNKLESEICSIDELLIRCQKLGYESIQDLFLDIFDKKYTIQKVINLIYLKNQRIEDSLLFDKSINSINRKRRNDIKVDNIINLDCTFKKCCCPLPFEEIKAVFHESGKICLHTKNCLNFAKCEDHNSPIVKQCDAQWVKENITKNDLYISKNFILCDERDGILFEITKVLKESNISIHSLELSQIQEIELVGGNILIYVHDLKELENIRKKILEIPNVRKFERMLSNKDNL